VAWAQRAKTSRGKKSLTIHSTQRDLITGIDHHLVGSGIDFPNRWESSVETDLGALVDERSRRSTVRIEALRKQMQDESVEPQPPSATLTKPQKPSTADAKAKKESLPSRSEGPKKSKKKARIQSAGIETTGQNNIAMAANIISFHMDEAKKIIQIHGNSQCTEYMIALRKKTDYELSQILVGGCPLIDENQRHGMITKADDSVSNQLKQANIPHFVSPPGSVQNLQSAIDPTGFCTSSIDLDRIMATGTPYDWSKKIVQQHKDFMKAAYIKYCDVSIPANELDASRSQCIANFTTVLQRAGLHYAVSDISSVMKTAEDEARTDFVFSTSNKSTTAQQSGNVLSIATEEVPILLAMSNSNKATGMQIDLTNNSRNSRSVYSAVDGNNSSTANQLQNLATATMPMASPSVTTTSCAIPITSTIGHSTWHPLAVNGGHPNSTIPDWRLSSINTSTQPYALGLTHPLNGYNGHTNDTILQAWQQQQQQQQWLSSQVRPTLGMLYGQPQPLPTQLPYMMNPQSHQTQLWPSAALQQLQQQSNNFWPQQQQMTPGNGNSLGNGSCSAPK
jgi:hypothetical protein